MIPVKINPIITYYGGKQRIASQIVKVFPDHHCYVEPFAGGLGCLFAKQQINRNAERNIEVINDINNDLINLYRVLQDPKKRKEFLVKLTFTPYSRMLHQESAKILKSDIDDSVLRAWAFYCNINISFASRLFAGFSYSKDKNKASVFKSGKQQLPISIKRLENVLIENLDALDCIKKYDGKNTLFYCDPPYVGADQGHYSGYKKEDLEKLINLAENSKGSFVLSGYNSCDINMSKWQLMEIEASVSAAKRKVSASVEKVWILDRSQVKQYELDLIF